MLQQLYLHHTTMNNINFQTDITRVSSENPYKQVYEVSKENSKALLAEIMEYNPDDITIEEEEIGVIAQHHRPHCPEPHTPGSRFPAGLSVY